MQHFRKILDKKSSICTRSLIFNNFTKKIMIISFSVIIAWIRTIVLCPTSTHQFHIFMHLFLHCWFSTRQVSWILFDKLWWRWSDNECHFVIYFFLYYILHHDGLCKFTNIHFNW